MGSMELLVGFRSCRVCESFLQVPVGDVGHPCCRMAASGIRSLLDVGLRFQLFGEEFRV